MRIRTVVACLFAVLAVSGSLAQPLGTGFNYQGRLEIGGQPANGPHDLQFRLFDALTDGNQIGPLFCFDGREIVGGLFTVSLDFGAAFAGEQRFLEIAVRADTTQGNCVVAGSYTTLSPRQPLSAAPNAAFALNASQLDGLDSAAFLQAVPLPLVLSGSDTDGVIRGVNSSAAIAQLSPGVYGENTATVTGPLAGGRFVSRGPNASGVVGEGTGSISTGGRFSGGGIGAVAISTNTEVSGGRGLIATCNSFIFGRGVSALVTAPTNESYGVHAESRSNQGTGAYGLASASTGQTIGVLGEAGSLSGIGVYGVAGGVAVRGDVLLSIDGIGGVFNNDLLPERSVELAGPNGAINTNGFLNREYTANTPRRAIPIAYGSVSSDGSINSGTTGNFTLVHTATGVYDITIDGEAYSNGAYTVTVTPVSNSPRLTGVADPGDALRVNIWNLSGTLVDNGFQFTVWKANPN